MKKFTVSGTFEGVFEIVYGDDGLLGEVTYWNSALKEIQRGWLQRNIPVRYDAEALQHWAKVGKLMLVEAEYVVTFDMFWDRYDMKYNRKRAEAAWMRMSKANQVRAFVGIWAYERHLALQTWKHKAHADTYLTQKFYETEWHKVRT